MKKIIFIGIISAMPLVAAAPQYPNDTADEFVEQIVPGMRPAGPEMAIVPPDVSTSSEEIANPNSTSTLGLTHRQILNVRRSNYPFQ